jgi:hypothetical protein
MRNLARIPRGRALLVATLAVASATGLGCRGRPGVNSGRGGNTGGGAGIAIAGVGGGGGSGLTGTGGTAGMAAPCAGASDPRLVVAGQRILRLTKNETLNTVRSLIGDTEAAALVADGVIGSGDDSADSSRRFPPLQAALIQSDDGSYAQLDLVADHVGSYVLANFGTISGCLIADDACAHGYLNKLAGRAYRRQLTTDEQNRFTALYDKLRAPQIVNGYQVTFTVEEAASTAVNALFRSPQMLWRWELGDPAMASASPAGIPLTDQELATQLAFFLTDQPPDPNLLVAANTGTLRANLAATVDTLLATPAAHNWLRAIVETYVGINRLPTVAVDPGKFPTFGPTLVSDMGTEAHKFLDDALWNGILTDLLLSRTTFLNTNLADNIYMVSVPAGASATDFGRTLLPGEQRSGLLTSAAFLTSRATFDGQDLVPARGVLVATVLLCMPQASDDPSDPYGLALGNYDNLGRYRTVDDLGRTIDAHATLPAAIGGGTVANGVELAQALATNPAFTSCMANALLRYAMVDPNTAVEAPMPPQQAGCATADVVHRYQIVGGKTFADLVRATTAAPAFGLRRAAP